MVATPFEGALDRGRTSLESRLDRWRGKRWAIAQCAVAAGVAWGFAQHVVGHPTPFFAPVAAVVSLGTSYGQRLRRVAEVTVGVALGVFGGDLLVRVIHTGAWQVALVVGLAMTIAILLDSGQVFAIQAAVQSIIVTTLLPDPNAGWTRWTDALVGGGVALVAATVVPAAPLRRPREQAAKVLRKTRDLLQAASEVMVTGDVDPALELLAEARATDHLIRELQDAADEGLDVVASSPFRIRHGPGLRKMADLVEPLDRALRSTRVLVRRTAVAAYLRHPVPHSYAVLTAELAAAVEVVATELDADRVASAGQPALLGVGHASGEVERSDDLSAEVILAQIRSVVVDLLMLTGMDPLEATDALPPARRD
ncbi:FUSC family protein [Nocardioides cynanchi]|uniref:FUSC family protein n=1 Tax=Nocardioides cynanchi TaxID=2558918 RepID=UPI001244FC47|nr:FUSC family protein [Nocardioides cynanchi]